MCRAGACFWSPALNLAQIHILDYRVLVFRAFCNFPIRSLKFSFCVEPIVQRMSVSFAMFAVDLERSMTDFLRSHAICCVLAVRFRLYARLGLD
jgi:hypothetical protein